MKRNRLKDCTTNINEMNWINIRTLLFCIVYNVYKEIKIIIYKYIYKYIKYLEYI